MLKRGLCGTQTRSLSINELLALDVNFLEKMNYIIRKHIMNKVRKNLKHDFFPEDLVEIEF
jgi:hypothetical protein